MQAVNNQINQDECNDAFYLTITEKAECYAGP